MQCGRIAFKFYDLCEKLWGGSPAVTSLDCVIESSNQKDVKQDPAGIYLLKVNNRNTRTRCEICSMLTIKTPERRRSRFYC